MIKGQRIPDSFKPQEQNIDSKAWHVEINRHESAYHHEYLHPQHSDDETTTSIGAIVLGAADKTTPIDADMIPVMDTADSNKIHKLSWANIKATLKTYFDSIYAPVATATFPGFGTTGTTACVGNDSRLSDSRTPVAHNQVASTITDFNAAALSAAPAETATTVGALINAATAITAPDDTDTIAMRNHTGGLLHKMTWAYVKSVLKTYFDTIYAASTQEAWTAPTLLNSWVNFNPTYTQAGYYKDTSGRVHIKGIVKNGTSITAAIFTLPAGYRPSLTPIFAVASNGLFGWLSIDTSGNVIPSAGSTAWISLDGISFKP